LDCRVILCLQKNSINSNPKDNTDNDNNRIDQKQVSPSRLLNQSIPDCDCHCHCHQLTDVIAISETYQGIL